MCHSSLYFLIVFPPFISSLFLQSQQQQKRQVNEIITKLNRAPGDTSSSSGSNSLMLNRSVHHNPPHSLSGANFEPTFDLSSLVSSFGGEMVMEESGGPGEDDMVVQKKSTMREGGSDAAKVLVKGSVDFFISLSVLDPKL